MVAPHTLDMEENYTTTQSAEELIEMFIDGTEEEVYEYGRLATVPRENDVALVAYGEHIIATIDGYEIDFYKNHYGKHSQTVTGYVSKFASLLNETETRNVTVHTHETPSMEIGRRVSDSAKYIDKYVGSALLTGNFSPVESAAVNEVEKALTRRMSEIFG